MPYADTTFADAFHNARISGEQWAALSPTARAAALQSASDALDLYAAHSGGWARDYTADPPDMIRRACCLEALALTNKATQARLQARRQGVSSLSIGSANESYNSTFAVSDVALSDASVAAMLRPYLKHTGKGVAIL